MNMIQDFKYMQAFKKGELHSFMTVLIPLCLKLIEEEPDRPSEIADNPSITVFNDELAKMQQLFDSLSKSFNKKNPSPESVYLKRQNEIRKSSFFTIRGIIFAKERNKENENYKLILELYSILKKYNKIGYANYKETTSFIDNFLHDISLDIYKELITKLALDEDIANIKTANEKFKSDTSKRVENYTQVVKYDYNMKTSILKNYRSTVFSINAMLLTNTIIDKEDIITTINGTITDYYDIIKRRLTTLNNKKINDRPSEI